MSKWRIQYAKDITPDVDDKEVLISGWVDTLRDVGKIGFIIMRDMSGKVQILIDKNSVSSDVMEQYKNINKESVISVKGIVKQSPKAPRGAEIIPSKIEILNPSESPLPIDIYRNSTSSLEKKLDYRFLDLRTPKSTAIFKIKSELIHSFREYFRKEGFIEFYPPLIVGAATEGGADLFPLIYFDREAFLAQSPQLYKEYLTCTNLEKVFCITPVFRAEKFDTPRHLNQFIQVDVEQAFADDKDVMEVLENTVCYGIDSIKKHCRDELNTLNVDVKTPQRPFSKYTYTQIIDILKDLDCPIEWGSDFSVPEYRKLEDKLGKKWYYITQWPSEAKPFYAYPIKENPKLTHSFDLMYGIQEISSGTQRIHKYDMLYSKLKEKGLNPDNFGRYLELRKYGCPPHSGWSIGPERMLVQLLGLDNIREVVMFPRDRNRLSP